jgi:photosystem II stability/assembly factor-like uncharacterized protein
MLFLLLLVLAGCGSDSDSVNVAALQALEPGTGEPVILDPAEYVPEPVILNPGGWKAQLAGLPVSLNDVTWNGERFIAVGDDGLILTSQDGIDWVQQSCGTDADLNAVTSDGPDIVAVGEGGTVLISTDQGENWTLSHREGGINLHAVVINAWQIVAGGRSRYSAEAFMMRSEDRGETWMAADSIPQSGHWSTGLVYAGGLFVAATDIPRSTGGTRVWVSVDGRDWQDIVLLDDRTAGLYSILHDGNQFIVSGDYGTVFTSPDGDVWTQSDTPLEEISYLSAVGDDSNLLLAGGITWWYWWLGEPAFGPLDVGLLSDNGGLTWSTFNIDGYFECGGMAWGNGRFVAVGNASHLLREGAVYTLD